MEEIQLSKYLIRQEQDIPLIKKFAFLGNKDCIDGKFKYLESLAENEKWVFKEKNQKEIYVLYHYIFHTFERCFNQGKLSLNKDCDAAAFNTGLMTSNGEDIFGIFLKNKYYEKGNNQRHYWFFEGFYEESNRKFMRLNLRTPQIATYFEEYNELFFDADAEIIVNFNHIVKDNFSRLPKSLQEIPDKSYISQILNGVLEQTKKRIKRNARIPVPQYYNGQIMFLLPLKVPDATVVLAIEKYENKYRANTIFTLGMAYNCARLLSRPETNWLLSGI